jgi:hypothetical protein
MPECQRRGVLRGPHLQLKDARTKFAFRTMAHIESERLGEARFSVTAHHF